MHTGYSPPETVGATTESSGSHTVAAPPYKVLAMASALDAAHVASTKPGVRSGVAVPAAPGMRRIQNVPVPSSAASGGIQDRDSDEGSKAPNSEGGTSIRLAAVAELLRRNQVLAQLKVEEMEVEVELAAARSARGPRRLLCDAAATALLTT